MAVKRKTSPRSTGTRAPVKRRKAASVKATALKRAVDRTERAARSLAAGTAKGHSKMTGLRTNLHRGKRKKARAAAPKSGLTRFAVAVGTALGRTERVARQAGQGALDTRDALERRVAALSKQLAQARADFKRAAGRKSR
jgi:hypothetical protein